MEERKEPQFWLKMAQIQQKLVSVAESLVRMKNPQFGGNKFCFWVKDAHVWLENDFVNVHVDEALILEKKAWFWLKNGFFCFGSSLSLGIRSLKLVKEVLVSQETRRNLGLRSINPSHGG